MDNIEERINYIEDVLETQQFNRVYEKQTFIQKITEKTRSSKLPNSARNHSQLSFFGNVFTQDQETTQDGLTSFRKSYANVNSLAPSTYVMTTVIFVCALISAVMVYRMEPPE